MDIYYLWISIALLVIVAFLNLIMFKKFKYTIREKEKINRKLHRLAHTDDLTGLYNHRYLVNYLEKEIKRARKHEKALAVLMLDIDYFKRYNDNHGHLKGDKLLIELSQVIKKSARGVDAVTRYGGEEFCVVLVDTGVKLATEIGERIRKSIENYPFKNREGQPNGKITVSVGVAGFPDHGNNGNDLIGMADQALYKAKLKRNKLEVYYPGLEALSEDTKLVAGLYQ